MGGTGVLWIWCDGIGVWADSPKDSFGAGLKMRRSATLPFQKIQNNCTKDIFNEIILFSKIEISLKPDYTNES